MDNQANRITLVRDYDPPKNREGDEPIEVRLQNQQADAVLRHVSALPNTPSLELVHGNEWVVNAQQNPIEADQDIMFQIDKVLYKKAEEGGIRLIKFSLYSSTLTAVELTAFVNELCEKYDNTIQQHLGSEQFYFEQKYRQDERMDPRGNPFEGGSKADAKKYELQRLPKHLSFVQRKFRSNKTFQSLKGPGIRRIEKAIHRFLNNKKWYDEKGIPWQLTILLSGKPGTGKTSTIGAVANLTGRHVVDVKASEILLRTQLSRLFYEEDLHVYTDENLSTDKGLHIPIKHRINVLEELDTVACLHSRASGNKGYDDDQVYGQVTLGDFLQALDGANQSDGRIIIITTNHPERLDAALTRAGRIHLKVELEYASKDTILEMYRHFFEEDLAEEFHSRLPDKQLSPADVSDVLQGNLETPELFVDELLARIEENRKEEEASALYQETLRKQKEEKAKLMEKATSAAAQRPPALRPTIQGLDGYAAQPGFSSFRGNGNTGQFGYMFQ